MCLLLFEALSERAPCRCTSDPAQSQPVSTGQNSGKHVKQYCNTEITFAATTRSLDDLRRPPLDVHRPRAPLQRADFVAHPGAGEVVVAVAGCGVCHTDLGYYYDGVRTNQPLPLALGHEISGRVVTAGAGAEAWLGRAVIVPAVLPCGECDLCRRGSPPSAAARRCRATTSRAASARTSWCRARAVPGRRAASGQGRADAGPGVHRGRCADHALPGGAPRRRRARRSGRGGRRRRRGRLLRAGGAPPAPRWWPSTSMRASWKPPPPMAAPRWR